MVKNLSTIQELQESQIQSLGQEDPLEEDIATHSSILAWRIPWTEDPGGLQSTGSQKSRTRLSDEHPGNYLPEGPDAGTDLGNTP